MLNESDIQKHQEWIQKKLKEGKHRPYLCPEYKKACVNIIYDKTTQKYTILKKTNKNYIQNNWSGDLLSSDQKIVKSRVKDIQNEINCSGCLNCDHTMIPYNERNIPESLKIEIENKIESEKNELIEGI